MEFLTLVIVMVLLQWWGSGGPVQRDGWLIGLYQSAAPVSSNPSLKLLMVVGLPVVAVLSLGLLLTPWLFGLAILALYVLVLLYSLGRGPLNEQVQTYLASWRAGNFESATLHAASLGAVDMDAISDEESLHRATRQAILYRGFERWFAVVFWFFLLGPMAALAYRLFAVLAENESVGSEDSELAARCLYWLDWLPVRLLGFTFALTGSFDDTFRQLNKRLGETCDPAELLDDLAQPTVCVELTETGGMTADELIIERGDKEIAAVQQLLFRSVVTWLIVLALLQIL